MFKNYFKIAYRNLLRYKSYTFINLFGLAVGIAATILILLYIQFEFSFDNFHENKENIYRISIKHLKESNIEYDSPQYTPPIGPTMLQEFPEVDNFVRFSTRRSAYFYSGDKALKVNGISHVDSSLFDIFSFKLLKGNPRTALAATYSLVLTQETASIFFGSEDPMGKTIKIDNTDSYTVTGVVEDVPINSHIQFNALISFSTLYKTPNVYLDWNGGNQYITYLKLRKSVQPKELEKKFPDFMWRHHNQKLVDIGVSDLPYLQPLEKIHINHDRASGPILLNILIFSVIAVLILFMACINFINLTTARSGKRAREVGVRKVLGAFRSSLIKQFLVESLTLSLLALIIALFLVELLMPVFSDLMNKDIFALQLLDIWQISGLILILLIVGLFAGSYPAFYISSFRASKILKGEFDSIKGRRISRDVLVVLQFAISITLIIYAPF